MILVVVVTKESPSAVAASNAKPGCADFCGDFSIPYPFGIGHDCYASEAYSVICDNSFTPPRPLLNGTDLQILEIALRQGTIRVWGQYITPKCPNTETPLVLSPVQVLEWGTTANCNSFDVNQTTNLSRSLCGSNSFCDDTFGGNNNALCYCDRGYDGNPYLSDGCQDIDECANAQDHDCGDMLCGNRPGSYICYCPSGSYVVDGYRCEKLNNTSKINNTLGERAIVVGISSGIGVLVVLTGMWRLWKVYKRRKKNKLKQKFFKRNGGLLLQQQLSSGEGDIDKAKVFTSEELEKATDYYNHDRILGQGGQGTVFKGMLRDGRIVAIKLSKKVDEGHLEQFINEVVILSQINHRNIIKIFGCCLETEVPELVYEFIPNGTLFQYIHEENEEFPLTWNKRVQIAAEIAGALSYLHSTASRNRAEWHDDPFI